MVARFARVHLLTTFPTFAPFCPSFPLPPLGPGFPCMHGHISHYYITTFGVRKIQIQRAEAELTVFPSAPVLPALPCRQITEKITEIPHFDKNWLLFKLVIHTSELSCTLWAAMSDNIGSWVPWLFHNKFLAAKKNLMGGGLRPLKLAHCCDYRPDAID